MVRTGVERVHEVMALLDETLLRAGHAAYAKLVELTTVSSTVGDVLADGIVEASNGTFMRVEPHTFGDLQPVAGRAADDVEPIEIKVAVDRNAPKGHLPKDGWYLTCRYSVVDAQGQVVGRMQRNDDRLEGRGDEYAVRIWEIRIGRLHQGETLSAVLGAGSDFIVSSTDGDSGKTASVRAAARQRMRLVYFNPRWFAGRWSNYTGKYWFDPDLDADCHPAPAVKPTDESSGPVPAPQAEQQSIFD